MRWLGLTDNPQEVKVRLKKGAWEVEITCSGDKIEQSVKAVLAGLSSSTVEQEEPSVQKERDSATCRGLIVRLWDEGFFVSERTLAAVDDELARKGYHYDRTAVSHTLADLVRENTLTRLGSMRSYRYVQKRPPQVTSQEQVQS